MPYRWSRIQTEATLTFSLTTFSMLWLWFFGMRSWQSSLVSCALSCYSFRLGNTYKHIICTKINISFSNLYSSSILILILLWCNIMCNTLWFRIKYYISCLGVACWPWVCGEGCGFYPWHNHTKGFEHFNHSHLPNTLYSKT